MGKRKRASWEIPVGQGLVSTYMEYDSGEQLLLSKLYPAACLVCGCVTGPVLVFIYLKKIQGITMTSGA